MIEMISVESSQISKMGHDPVSKVMRVEFHGGSVYEYQNVTAETFTQILEAPSIGKEFNFLIKKNAIAYPYQRVVYAAETWPTSSSSSV